MLLVGRVDEVGDHLGQRPPLDRVQVVPARQEARQPGREVMGLREIEERVLRDLDLGLGLGLGLP